MTHKPSKKANEVCWGIQSLDGTTEYFMLHCFTLLSNNVNSPGHIWSTSVAGSFSHSIGKYYWDNAITCRCDVGIKKHCFVPRQAVRPQCHDEVLQSFCSGAVVFCLELIPNIWTGRDWAPICKFGRWSFLFFSLPQHKLITMAMEFTIHGCLAAVAKTDQATFTCKTSHFWYSNNLNFILKWQKAQYCVYIQFLDQIKLKENVSRCVQH